MILLSLTITWILLTAKQGMESCVSQSEKSKQKFVIEKKAHKDGVRVNVKLACHKERI